LLPSHLIQFKVDDAAAVMPVTERAEVLDGSELRQSTTSVFLKQHLQNQLLLHDMTFCDDVQHTLLIVGCVVELPRNTGDREVMGCSASTWLSQPAVRSPTAKSADMAFA
jgi:hypothetical protein